MEPSFWHKKWQDNQIGFHEGQPNQLLTDNFDQLQLAQGARLFIPLCGKTVDIAWFLAQGYKVVGAELSQIAIKQLFIELNVEPHITNVGNLQHYRHTNIDIFVGDIFDITAEILGQIDGIYDRAAMVALPDQTRDRYSQLLIKISNGAPQLLICFDYDQSTRQGPPFSIDADEVRKHYAQHYRIRHLAKVKVEQVTSAISVAEENIWLLQRLTRF